MIRRIAPLFVALSILVVGAPTARAADDEGFRLDTHGLRRILYENHFTALNSWDEINDPRDTVLILLGDNITLASLQATQGGLLSFVQRGGTVLLATDRTFSHPDLVALTGYRIGEESGISEEYVTAWSTRPNHAWGQTVRVAPEAVYRGDLVDCLLLQPTEKATPDVFYSHNDFGIQGGKLTVSTNRPSMLVPAFGRRVTRQITPLAYLPRGAWYGNRYPMEHPQPAVVHAQYGQGELLLFSDHTVFLNEMMLRRDLGNFEMAMNVVSQLRGSENPRTKVLFIHDGRIITKLDVPIQEISIPLRVIERMIVDVGNDAIQQLQAAHQADNRLDETVVDGVNDARPIRSSGGLFYVVIFLGAIAFICYLVSRMVRATNTTDLTLPLFSRAQAKVAPLPSLVGHRFEGMKQSENFGEVARAVVREWFANLPGGRMDGSELPKVEVEGGWWTRWKMARLVRSLWALARGIEPRRVSLARFQRTLRELEDLSRDIRKGRLRVQFM